MLRAHHTPIMVCFLLFCFVHTSQGDHNKRILLIHSYHAEYPWVAAITRGVQQAIKGKQIDFDIFYMDTKRKTSQEWKIQSGKLAREKIHQWNPSVVITADDNAQLFVTHHYLNKEPFFVFCGVNAEPEQYGFPAKNVTGIIERPHYQETISYLQEILGPANRLRRIAVLSDREATSIGALSFMRKEKLKVKTLSYNLTDDFNIWKERINKFNRDADALFMYMYHTVKKENQELSMEPRQVMKWVQDNCKIPTGGFFDFSVEDGMLCGVVESGEEHGYKAAKIALGIIEGIYPSKLPNIVRAQKGVKMINLKTAKKLGIHISQKHINEAYRVIQ